MRGLSISNCQIKHSLVLNFLKLECKFTSIKDHRILNYDTSCNNIVLNCKLTWFLGDIYSIFNDIGPDSSKYCKLSVD